jgi:hypothetical protein
MRICNLSLRILNFTFDTTTICKSIYLFNEYFILLKLAKTVSQFF